MSKYLNATLTFIGVWFAASLINGLLSSVCILILDDATYHASTGIVAAACLFSFACSIPLAGLVWLVTIIAMACGKYGHDLFQIILTAALFCGTIGAIFFLLTFGKEFNQSKYCVAFCVIFSAMSGVLFFRQPLKITKQHV